MSKLVYVSGDSFTSGDELADTGLVGYPGLRPLKTVNPEIDHIWFKKKPEIASKLAFDLKAESKKRSWPSKLESSAITVVNSSYPGNSMESISKRVLIDLERIVPDVVIIQITGISRLNYTADTSPYFTASCPIFAIDSIECKSEIHRRILKATAVSKTDDEFLIDYLYWLHIVNVTVKAKTGSYPILVDSCFLDRNRVYFENINVKSNDLDILMSASRYNLVDKNSMSYFNKRLNTVNNVEYIMPLGHYAENVHEEFAKYIAETYLQ